MTRTLEVMPELPAYVAPQATQIQLEYADLAVIDLSKANTPLGRVELAKEVCIAMKTQGFFYAINHGYTAEQTSRMFSIANLTFDGVDDEEKRQYAGESEQVYDGYKLKKTWLLEKGIYDQIEHYNINKNVRGRGHPKALQPYIPVLEEFTRHNYDNILHPILRLLAIGMELPEYTFVKQHTMEKPSHTSVRFMKYYPRDAEEEIKTKNVWLKGHTDFGSISILYSQPVGGLQILSPDGKWRWIRHMENALVINTGDALQFLSGGYYLPTRHRVVQPPADQTNIPRLGVFCFCMADDDVKLLPHEDSPVLQKLGIQRLCNPEVAPTMEEWRKERTKSYGRVPLKLKENGVEEEIISGIVVKHYN